MVEVFLRARESLVISRQEFQSSYSRAPLRRAVTIVHFTPGLAPRHVFTPYLGYFAIPISHKFVSHFLSSLLYSFPSVYFILSFCVLYQMPVQATFLLPIYLIQRMSNTRNTKKIVKVTL